ncbi:MAG: shikimate dehydrogenase [Clostridia bacterium]|nr:shikimate dehydrogenase [Clostridia bacterium]
MERKLAVLGRPIAHSLTPPLMALISAFHGDSADCDRIDCGEAELKETVKSLVTEGRDGFNCTMPLKTEMAGLCSDISVEAEILRSVNSARIEADGTFSGITTDGAGMVAAIREKGGEVTGRNVILLGAGGAARSIALSLCREGVKKLTVLNRTLSSLEPVVEMLRNCGCDTEIITDAVTAADKYTSDCHVLINATSCGMHGSAEFDSLDFVDSLPSDAAVADAVYNPRETALIKKAAERGLITVPGLYMLIWQGILAYDFFTGRDSSGIDTVHIYNELSK